MSGAPGRRIGLVAGFVFASYLLLAGLVWSGLLGSDWKMSVGPSLLPPSFGAPALWAGTDLLGRSVLWKGLQGAGISVYVGVVSALLAVSLGCLLGALGGFFGGWIDRAVVWSYTVISSVPNILLLSAVAYVLGRGLGPTIVAFGLTGWVTVARLLRAEYGRHRGMDYVLAARALGVGTPRILLRHVFPNVAHLALVALPLQFAAAVKAEVLLSFLGLGAQGEPSWGLMIEEARLEILRRPCAWWQLAVAGGALLVLVLAVNVFVDFLRDALEPKIK